MNHKPLIPFVKYDLLKTKDKVLWMFYMIVKPGGLVRLNPKILT